MFSYQLTAGGNNEAEIATPTKELTPPVVTANATPHPLGIAITAPIISPEASPLELGTYQHILFSVEYLISLVGQL